MDWEEYFNELAVKETEEYKKVGWGSKESMYSKFYIAMNLLSFDKYDDLLDIGCGTGAFEKLLQNRYDFLMIHAIDISEEQLRIARQKSPYVNFDLGSITDIPYADSYFDCITCIGILQNFNGALDDAISEMYRVLKDRGKIFIVTMDAEYEGFSSGWRKPNLIMKYYRPNELIKVLEQKGFTITDIGAISSKRLEGEILPLHQSHTFFILGEKR